MKLLICTQAIDRNDPALGFFVSWVREFAKHFEQITVICLFCGEYELPLNVEVFSLGKEARVGGVRIWKQLRYAFRFQWLIWRHRHGYDVVFVHMNAEYAVLGGLSWRFLGKKIALWYNHPAGHSKVRLAAGLAHRVFCTSEKSFTARYQKTHRMPVGIDTEQFKKTPNVALLPKSILSLGRISKHKRIHILIDGLKILSERGILFNVDIYGNAPPAERGYAEALREQTRELETAGMVNWHPGVPYEKTPQLFNEHSIFVNLSVPGMFDKTILEAMASEMLTLTSNPVLKTTLPPELFFRDSDATDFAEKAAVLLDLPEAKRQEYGAQLRDYVVREHTLAALGRKLREEFEQLGH